MEAWHRVLPDVADTSLRGSGEMKYVSSKFFFKLDHLEVDHWEVRIQIYPLAHVLRVGVGIPTIKLRHSKTSSLKQNYTATNISNFAHSAILSFVPAQKKWLTVNGK